MKIYITVIVSLLLWGCSPLSRGDYVSYTSDDYLFMQDSFINQKIECLELGELKEGGMRAKYCVGRNYGSKLVQGFIFEHEYRRFEDRYIGATLSFKTRNVFKIQCNAEIIEGKSSGTEYINCMVPQNNFDLYRFIMSTDHNVYGRFSAPVGNTKVYNGVISAEGKALLKAFYKKLAKEDRSGWKSRRL